MIWLLKWKKELDGLEMNYSLGYYYLMILNYEFLFEFNICILLLFMSSICESDIWFIAIYPLVQVQV